MGCTNCSRKTEGQGSRENILPILSICSVCENQIPATEGSRRGCKLLDKQEYWERISKGGECPIKKWK